MEQTNFWNRNRNGWNNARRAKQAAAIPWQASTGPKTETGKEIVAQNARKLGFRSREFQERARLIRKMLAGAKRVALLGLDHE